MARKHQVRRPLPAQQRQTSAGRPLLTERRAAQAPPVGAGADRLVARGLQLHQAGRIVEAEALYRQALALVPSHADVLHLLGLAAVQTGRVVEADASIRAALKLAPRNAAYWNSLGAVARVAGRLPEAGEHFARAATLAPESVDAWANLVTICQAIGDAAGEAVALERLTALQPGQGRVWGRRGVLAIRAGQLAEAEALLTRAATLAADDPEIWSNLGAAQLMQGRSVDAEVSQRRALAIQPDFPSALNNLGSVLVAQSRWAEAAEVLDRAVKLTPDEANSWVNLAHAWKGLEQYTEAVAAYERVLALTPGSVAALVGRGDALQGLGDLERAIGAYERVLALDAENTEAYEHLEIALRRLGRLVEAEVAACRRAVILDPDSASALSRLIVVLDLHEGGELEAQQARRRWNERFGHPSGNPKPDSAGAAFSSPEPGRRLRVGYVSADFRHHSAGYVILPLLCAHDREQVEVICYSGVLAPDPITEEFKSLADIWHDTARLSDDDLEAFIRADRIDILVDLSGHTDGNRLPVLARKPAPVQITAWGYATGTGLDAMDYFLTDRTLVPAEARAGHTEEVVDLPSVVCYEPPPYAPPVAPLPAIARGHITFGAFNRLPKLSAQSRDTWACVLAANPTSRLVVKCEGLADSAAEAWFLDGLAAHGVAPERVTILGGTPHAEHLAAHAEIDLMLDTFPHGGGVTTLDAAAMGVPVVTLLEQRPAGRVSASVLAALGLLDLVANSTDQYVEIATALAGDVARLTHLRATLRERLLASPAGDRAAYARAVEDTYRTLWRRQCVGAVRDSVS